ASKGQNLDPAFSPDGRFIAYSSNVSGDFDIWLVDVNGRHQAKLTSMLGDERKPQFSPDGKKIAFIHTTKEGSDLWIVNRDGSSLFRLTKNSASKGVFEWSSNGELIVYEMLNGSNRSIWFTDIDGMISKLVCAGDCYDPSWGHDGRLVYVRRTMGEYKLELVEVSSNSPKQIFSTTREIRLPKFSNDDKRIFFLYQSSERWNLFVADVLTGDAKDLLEHPPGGVVGGLTWKPILTESSRVLQRPNNPEIVFSGYSTYERADLFVVMENGTIELTAGAFGFNVPATRIERLTEKGYKAILDFAWNPEGSMIVYAAQDDNLLTKIIVRQYVKVKEVSLYGR
ncbi:MAG: hypothetical protein QXF82_06475, partial [Nitrososphaeria archaeon]